MGWARIGAVVEWKVVGDDTGSGAVRKGGSDALDAVT